MRMRVTREEVARALTWALNQQRRALRLTPGQRASLRRGGTRGNRASINFYEVPLAQFYDTEGGANDEEEVGSDRRRGRGESVDRGLSRHAEAAVRDPLTVRAASGRRRPGTTDPIDHVLNRFRDEYREFGAP